jgi:hypothetical protein
VQAAHRNDSTAGRGGRKRRMLAVALAQARQEGSDIASADVLDLCLPGCGQGVGVALQVTAVSRQSVLGQPALDGQVIEIPPDSPGEGGQLSTSASGTLGRPCASATGAQVMLPS